MTVTTPIALPVAPAAPRIAHRPRQASDRLLLRDCLRVVEIGAFGEERGVTQSLRFNLTVDITPADLPLADDVDRILSYDTLVQAIDAALDAGRVNLLETLAEDIATRLLREPAIRHVTLRIEKLDRGPHALGIEIDRSADSLRPADLVFPDTALRRPVIVHLSAAATYDARLGVWLDQFLQGGDPMILTTGAPAGTALAAGTQMAQRQIDLLSLDQGAWHLASRDPRCRVMETRTELRHGIDTGLLSVWAPAKMLRDAGDTVPSLRGAELAGWLAEQMNASALYGLGGVVPGGVPLALADDLSL